MNFETVQIASPDGRASASFVPRAGLLCCSLQDAEAGIELLDHGRGVDAYAERGKTMAIPLLYPWANRLADFGYEAGGRQVALAHHTAELSRDENELPIHGVIPQLMAWQAKAEGPVLSARLDWSAPSLQRLFPFRHEVQIAAQIAAGELTISTTVRAGADGAVPVSFGFHPYLRLPGGPREEVIVELPRCERLRTDELSIPTGASESLGPLTFNLADSGWDDGLALSEQPARFTATGSRGTVAVDMLEGFAYAQIYAPPGRDYICFEPMTAPTNALRSGDGLIVLGAGEEHRATFRVSW